MKISQNAFIYWLFWLPCSSGNLGEKPDGWVQSTGEPTLNPGFKVGSSMKWVQQVRQMFLLILVQNEETLNGPDGPKRAWYIRILGFRMTSGIGRWYFSVGASAVSPRNYLPPKGALKAIIKLYGKIERFYAIYNTCGKCTLWFLLRPY